jgi:hypothetical protein
MTVAEPTFRALEFRRLAPEDTVVRGQEFLPRRWKRRTATGLVAVVALLVGCTIEYAPPDARQAATAPEADTTLVVAELRGYYRDLSDRHWEAFADHFWPGATITTVWQAPGASAPYVTVTTVPEFVAAAPEGPGSQAIFEESMLEARIRRTGNLAQAWVRYQARFGNPGDVREWSGLDAFTLMQHEGRWRIVALAFASDGGGP